MADELTLQYEFELVGGEIVWTPGSASGHQFANQQGDVGIWIDNMRGTSIVVTFLTARESDFGVFPDKVITCAAAAITKLPTFNPRRFTTVGTGKTTFTLSETTDVQVAALVQQQYFKES